MKNKPFNMFLRVAIVLFSAACLSFYVACQARTPQAESPDHDDALMSGSKSRMVAPPDTEWLAISSSKSAAIVLPEGWVDRGDVMWSSKSGQIESESLLELFPFELFDLDNEEAEEEYPDTPYDGVDFEDTSDPADSSANDNNDNDSDE